MADDKWFTVADWIAFVLWHGLVYALAYHGTTSHALAALAVVFYLRMPK